ncbi:MAG TPA: NmrA family NAD(P)-binding protein [Planctomycetota bacterium]|nr:NmrA family NAD(P)-binding protein [Planctomycetota bacterium]
MPESIDPISASPEAPRSGALPEQPVEVKPDEPARKIAIVGEIPFSGRALAHALLKEGFAVRVLCPDEPAEVAALSAKPAGQSGSIETVRGALDSAKAIEGALEGAYGVCFLSPITMKGRMYRSAQHVEDVRRLATAAQNGAIRKLVYHSALGAHPESQSLALRQAAEAEEIIHGAKCEDFRVRTGPLMGRGDGFLSEILNTVRSPNPILRVWGYGSTTVQPIHVDDMAQCLTRIFSNQPEELQPGYYCLGGPEITTLLDLMDNAAARLSRAKLKIHIPLFVLKMMSSMNQNSTFREQVNLLFDGFYTEQNDALKLLSPGRQLVTPRQAQEEILAGAKA